MKRPRAGFAKFADIYERGRLGKSRPCALIMKDIKRSLELIAADEYDGLRVDEVLRRHFKISGSIIKALKKHDDGILLNGQQIRTVDHIKKGDVLSVTMHEGLSENIEPQDIPIDVMYEDEDVLVVNKQPGIPTHPSAGHPENTLANGVMAHYERRGEMHVFRAVNRLDRDTSGVMCIAKNSYSHARLAEAMKTGELVRKYTAIVCGKTDDCGTIDAPIARVGFIERGVQEDGQRAVTHYRRLKSFDGYTLTELRLDTGRTHQIRVHMAYIGCPLLGDWLYGEEDKELFPRQALHSSYLRLIHPVTGKKLVFEPQLAPDMQKFIELLQK